MEIWDLSHAHKIHAIMQKVFGDMDGTNSTDTMEEFSSDEEDDLLYYQKIGMTLVWMMNLLKWQWMN